MIEETTSYLNELRQRFRADEYTHSEYSYCAAKAYIAMGLPLRALALLKKLDYAYTLGAGYLTVKELIHQTLGLLPAQHQTCSLNMIVKNESGNIRAALESVDGIFDEIVVCDTGSTDDTRDIALSFGAVVIDIPWISDFSHARNQAINASGCNWIFWMDADDRIDTASCAALSVIWRNGPPVGLRIRVVNKLSDNRNFECLQTRMFPRRIDLRFERRIHEQISPAIVRANLPLLDDATISLVHTGYASRELMAIKARRNKMLLDLETATYPDEPSLWLSKADNHIILDEYDEAKLVLEQITENPDNFTRHPDVYCASFVRLASICERRNDYSLAQRYLYRCLYCDPTRLDALFMLASLCKEAHDDRRACWFFLQCTTVQPKIGKTAVDITTIRIQAIYNLAELYIQWKRFDEANDLLTHAIKTYPHVVDFFSQLGVVMLQFKRTLEAAHHFSHSRELAPSKNPGAYIGLATIYIKLGTNERALEVLRDAVLNDSDSPEIQMLLCKIYGEYNAAKAAMPVLASA